VHDETVVKVIEAHVVQICLPVVDKCDSSPSFRPVEAVNDAFQVRGEHLIAPAHAALYFFSIMGIPKPDHRSPRITKLEFERKVGADGLADTRRTDQDLSSSTRALDAQPLLQEVNVLLPHEDTFSKSIV
jgi:hypothetical protein